ncbi:MAG: ABC transporter substrate-binding protein [Deltaproteobacteria bacterium]|nr:ABC transporter substrate-binding protein [Deltaproteobacteria bacterium]
MDRRLLALLLAGFFLAAAPGAPGAPAAVRITDDTGDIIRLDAPAMRIVTLYAAFSDILAGMDLADRIVGRTKTDDAVSPNIPSVGTHMRPSMELVLGLKPDLVLQMGGRAEAAQSVADLRRNGVPTAFFRIRTFADLFSVIRRVGALTDAAGNADALILSLQARLDALHGTLDAAGPVRPTVFFEVRYPNLLGAGPDSMVTDIIRAAGGRNILAQENSSRTGRIVRLSEEELLRLNPDAYCVQQGPMNKNPVPLAERPHFTTLRAVVSKRILTVDEHLFSRPGPLAVDAAETLAKFLHPGLFPLTQEYPAP